MPNINSIFFFIIYASLKTFTHIQYLIIGIYNSVKSLTYPYLQPLHRRIQQIFYYLKPPPNIEQVYYADDSTRIQVTMSYFKRHIIENEICYIEKKNYHKQIINSLENTIENTNEKNNIFYKLSLINTYPIFKPVDYRFINITLFYHDKEYIIDIETNYNYYLEGNKLNDLFFKWYVKIFNNITLKNKYYVSIIDNNYDMIELDTTKNYIIFNETNYTIEQV